MYDHYDRQDAAKNNSKEAYSRFVESSTKSSQQCSLRGQLDFNFSDLPLDISEIEDAKYIVRRFCTGNWNTKY